MTLLMHISDTHFGTERPAVVRAVQALAQEQQPGVLVLSGDITQRGRRRQFEAARRFVDGLRVPRCLAIPGNHDIPLFNPLLRLFAPYANQMRSFGAELEPRFETDELLVITVNTTRPWRHKNGEVSAAQVAAVARQLAAATARQLRIVVTHQPVAVTQAIDRANLLRGGRQAVERWAQAGADLILGGHIHLPCVLPLHEAGEANRRVWAVQAGTAVSSRIRHEAGNSVNLIRWNGGAATGRRAAVERWDYVDADERFHRVDVHDCAFDGG